MTDFSWAPEELRASLLYKNGKLMVGCSEPSCDALRSTAGKGAVLKKVDKGLLESLLYCREHGGFWGKFSPEQIASWPEGHKMCKTCREVKPFTEFHKHNQALFGYAVECKQCRKPDSKAGWQARTFEQTMLASAKHRCTKSGREFSIALEDIVIPELCPVFKVPLVLERNHPYRPSLDRINPNLGYTKGNIIVMSWRANTLKNNMTPYEASMLSDWLEENGNYTQVMGLERVVGSVTYTRPGGIITDVTVLAGELNPDLPPWQPK